MFENGNTQFFVDCRNLKVGETLHRDSISFEELFNLKYPFDCVKDYTLKFLWGKFKILAKTKKEFTMNVWNGNHPVEENTTKHVAPSNTQVLIWMISRFGDVGITDNLKDAKGYDCRGVDNEELFDWEITRLRE